MIDFVNIKSVTKSLITDVMHLTPAQVRFRDEAEGATWTNDPSIWLALRGLGEIGQAERRTSLPASNQDEIVTTVVAKTFTMSVRAESFTQDESDPKHAGLLLETLKTRLHRRSSINRISGLFAIAEYKPTQRVDYKSDGRQVSAYIMDLICTTMDADVDDSAGAGGWINEVLVSGTVKNVRPSDVTVSKDIKGV